MSTTAIKTYLEPELARAVAQAAKAQGRSESALIADAIRWRLASTAEEVIQSEEVALKRQLNRLELRFDKLLWEQAQFKQCLLLFVRVWLEHNPPLDPETEDAAAASAEARFHRFLDLVSNGLTSGEPLGNFDVLADVAPQTNGNGYDSQLHGDATP